MASDRFARHYSALARRLQPSPVREICSLVTQPGMRSLAGGWPDPAIFHSGEITQIITELLADRADQALQYGSTEGLLPLCQELALQARNEGDKDCQPENILLTHGSCQGLDLASRVFIDPGDVILVGLPTYFGATGGLSTLGAKLTGVPVDDEGLNTGALAEELERLKGAGQPVKAVYVIPNFQNPTGATLTLERRRRLLDLACQHDLMIFEDDPYGELRYEGRALPSLKALDESGRVVHLRSFSKTLAPGLRLGWLSGETKVVRQLALLKQYVDACTNSLGQHLLYELMRRGLYEARLKVIIAHYRRKRDFILKELSCHFPPSVRWNRPEGGFFLWVHLPQNIDADDLLAEAADRKVVFIAGRSCFVDGGGRNTMRLSFAQAGEEETTAAVAELGRLIKKHLGRKTLSQVA